MKEKLRQATSDILFKNMQIKDIEYKGKSIVCVYDTSSELSKLISESYVQNLSKLDSAICMDFDKFSREEIKQKLMSLPENSTVILVQSTNFRLDDFRIRLNLNNQGVGCLEHNHLAYIQNDQIENYIDSIVYNTPYYEGLSDIMYNIFSTGETLKMKTCDGNILTVKGGFEKMRRNTGYYINKSRGGTFPIGENFTEARNFSKVNGSFSVYAYPDSNFQVQFCTPFVVDIKESILTCSDNLCPTEFRKILDKIEASEDGEVFVRELGFGMNTGISKEKRLSDVGAYERVTGFHLSLGKKHNIYRKKIHKSITQRYHIDIFPDVDTISVDDKVIFEGGKYII